MHINTKNLFNRTVNLSENIYTESLEEINRYSLCGLFLRFVYRDELDSKKLCNNIESEIKGLIDRGADLTEGQKTTAVANLNAMEKKFSTSKLDDKARECSAAINRTIQLILQPTKKPTPRINTQARRQQARRSTTSSPQTKAPVSNPVQATPKSNPVKAEPAPVQRSNKSIVELALNTIHQQSNPGTGVKKPKKGAKVPVNKKKDTSSPSKPSPEANSLFDSPSQIFAAEALRIKLKSVPEKRTPIN